MTILDDIGAVIDTANDLATGRKTIKEVCEEAFDGKPEESKPDETSKAPTAPEGTGKRLELVKG